MSKKKPVRIEGDPEGYEPVFDGDEYGCPFCDIRGTKTCNSDGVCLSILRPEKRGVHYVKKESSK
jgi:hypothetical protein